MIYFVQSGDGGPIKIGFAKTAEVSPRQRALEAGVAALQLKIAEHAMKGIDDWPGLVAAVVDAYEAALADGAPKT